jgi:large subunit ribosomal protein L36e
VAYLSIDFVAFSNGAGIHQWNVPREQFPTYAKAVHAKEVGYAPVIYFTKLSILLQFLRIFVPRRGGRTFYCIHALIWLNLIYYILYFFTTLFLCVPQRKMWEPHIPGRCFSLAAVIISAAFINIISDVLMFLIPLFCISTLQMPKSRKLGIAAVFAVGLFVCFTSVMRTPPSFNVIGAKDLTWELIPLAFWADAEITAGIICGCMPVLPAFYRHIVPHAKACLGSRSRTKDYRASRTYRKSKELSLSHSGPSVAKPRNRNVVAPWEDAYVDSRILQGSYLELDDKVGEPNPEFGGTRREEMSKDIADESQVREIDDKDLESGL